VLIFADRTVEALHTGPVMDEAATLFMESSSVTAGVPDIKEVPVFNDVLQYIQYSYSR
jgi:hypothetical protein